MLKIKDNIQLKALEKYGFTTPLNNRLRQCTYWENGIVKLWVDKHRYLHYNCMNIKTIDLIYQMHNILELVDDKEDLRRLSTPKLLEENKQLKEELKKIKEFIDKHIAIVEETGTKYLITSVKDDNELINIINEILGDKENE